MTIELTSDPNPGLEGEAPLRGDARITASRSELKYLVPYEGLKVLSAELNRRLPSHRFTGEGANPLPDPHHYVTTVYFDTPTLRHFRAAQERGEDDIKVRAKAYYDIHPALAEVATDPDEIVHAPSVVMFEIKRRTGDHTSKVRFRLVPGDVPAFFERGEVAPRSAALVDAGSPEGRARASALEYCAGLDEPLVCFCLVNYRRLSFQDAEGELRVTLDLGLSYYRPRDDVWSSRHSLERSALGAPASRESRAVLEVKAVDGGAPAWLDAILQKLELAPVRFSKFVAAVEAVHGRR